MNPTNLKYTKDHEWVRLDPGNSATIGITDFAAESLGDVVFLQLPEIGTQLVQHTKLGEVESVKAVSDIFSPISGKVIAVNEKVINKAELVNQSPYDSGWLVKVEMKDASEADKLMSVKDYEAFLATQEQ